MTLLEIRKCNDIDTLKNLCLEYKKQIDVIGEILVAASKYHCSDKEAINSIRSFLMKNHI